MWHMRIMRLCVHPAVQRRGIGMRLLRRAIEESRLAPGVDTVGACFGATAMLLKFWRAAGAHLVWLGHGCEPCSGHHSATVLVPCSERAENLVRRLQARFAFQLPDFLLGPLSHIELDILAEILASLPPPNGCPSDGEQPSEQDLADLRSFALGARQLSSCRYALVRAALAALRPPRQPFDSHAAKLLMDLLQGRELHEGLLRKLSRELPWSRLRNQGETPQGGDGAMEPHVQQRAPADAH
mmetsp:Transcript_84673/g.236312  ORF Transcript_84673/g.236312 Transcript_84673/m.236312 type:complete len:241 (+) Transcript_84673:3-725(+)